MKHNATVNTFINVNLLLFLFCALCCPTQATAIDQKNVTIVTIDYPPLLGGPGTIMTDIVTSAFQEAGIKVNFNVYPLARVVKVIVTGNAQAALGSRNWFNRAQDKDAVSFVTLYWLNMNLFYLKERFPKGLVYKQLSDLAAYRIAYIRGGALIPIFAKAKIKPELVATLRQNVKKVYAGRDDMFAATELGGWSAIKKYYPDSINQFSSAEKPIYDMSADIIFAPNQQALLQQFNQGLDAIKKNGTYLAIVNKYYDGKKIPDAILNINAQRSVSTSEHH